MQQLRVLLVEDNEGDVIITNELLKTSEYNVSLTVCIDGAAAVSYLNNAATPPDLILLDNNLPDSNGLELIKLFKNTKRWKLVPVLLFVSSLSESELWIDEEFKADHYLKKPLDISKFDQIAEITQLQQFN